MFPSSDGVFVEDHWCGQCYSNSTALSLVIEIVGLEGTIRLA